MWSLGKWFLNHRGNVRMGIVQLVCAVLVVVRAVLVVLRTPDPETLRSTALLS